MFPSVIIKTEFFPSKAVTANSLFPSSKSFIEGLNENVYCCFFTERAWLLESQFSLYSNVSFVFFCLLNEFINFICLFKSKVTIGYSTFGWMASPKYYYYSFKSSKSFSWSFYEKLFQYFEKVCFFFVSGGVKQSCVWERFMKAIENHSSDCVHSENC